MQLSLNIKHNLGFPKTYLSSDLLITDKCVSGISWYNSPTKCHRMTNNNKPLSYFLYKQYQRCCKYQSHKYKYKYLTLKYKYKYKYSGHKYKYKYKYFKMVLEYYSSTSTNEAQT